MKFILTIIVFGFFLQGMLTPASAAMAVVDIGLIKTNLANARRDLAQQILQGKHQVTQIKHMVDQIRQLDTHLQRLGDPRQVTVATLNEAVSFLNKVTLSKSSGDIIRDIGQDEVFKTRSGSPYTPVKRDITFRGEVVAKQDPDAFKPEVAARRSFEHYREVRAAVLKEREVIKRDMATTLNQLRVASSDSEVQKLNIVLRSLESRLEASDREIQFAASEVMTRYFQNRIEERVQAKAEVQRQRAALRTGTRKDIRFYHFPSKPVLFKR